MARTATMVPVGVLWLSPPPGRLTLQAWRRFASIAAPILSALVSAPAIVAASVFAVGAVVLTGLLRPIDADAGFVVRSSSCSCARGAHASRRHFASRLIVASLGVVVLGPVAHARLRTQAVPAPPPIVVLATGGSIAGAAAANVRAGCTPGQIADHDKNSRKARVPLRLALLKPHRVAGGQRLSGEY